MQTTPKLWYQEQVIGKNTISKVVKELVRKAKIEGFFTNHSLRRSGGTRLFRAGVDRKLVKEFTGHRSDAVDSYQVTSFEQRQMLSKVVQGVHNNSTLCKTKECECKNSEKLVKVDECKEKVTSENLEKVEVTPGNVAAIVTELLKSTKNNKKTVIRIEVEVHND